VAGGRRKNVSCRNWSLLERNKVNRVDGNGNRFRNSFISMEIQMFCICGSFLFLYNSKTKVDGFFEVFQRKYYLIRKKKHAFGKSLPLWSTQFPLLSFHIRKLNYSICSRSVQRLQIRKQSCYIGFLEPLDWAKIRISSLNLFHFRKNCLTVIFKWSK